MVQITVKVKTFVLEPFMTFTDNLIEISSAIFA